VVNDEQLTKLQLEKRKFNSADSHRDIKAG